MEDLILFCLDTLSPCDTKFIFDHCEEAEDESVIDLRLNSQEYWRKVKEFKKLPVFIFEIIFIREGNWISRSLMILTTNRLIPLRCRQDICLHEFSIPQVKLSYSQSSSYGVDCDEVTSFIRRNCRKHHLAYFRKSSEYYDILLSEADVDFREFNIHQNNEEISHSVDPDHPIIIDEKGDIHMKPQHQDTFRRIVKAIGKNKWEEATHLLLDSHENIIDFDAEDTEIYQRMSEYYRTHLDEDLVKKDFTENEDKCLAILFAMMEKIIRGENIWSQISRHMTGRFPGQIKQRFIRKSSDPQDISLENIRRYSGAGDYYTALKYYERGHAVSLTIVPKTCDGLDVTMKLQKQVNVLVVGTEEEIFILHCKYTALRCNHPGLHHEKFTYDPTRHADQFSNFIRLTFANSLKKAGKIDRQNFHFTDIQYNGEDIHEMMSRIEKERFYVPREIFINLNSNQLISLPRQQQQEDCRKKRKL